MLGVSHLLISATATSLILGTANPTIIMVGAIAGLLPDIDVSTSPAGRVLPWVSAFFENRMPHRSCTHSLVASAVVAVLGYGITILLEEKSFIAYAHAVTIGYFFGWFADCFTRGGVEMFWPSPVRCVCPGNRNFRLKTGSNAEYGVLITLVAIAFAVFSLNSNGGLLTQFNRLIASPSGVEQIYNQSGSTHLIIANIKGVRTSDRSKITGDFLIIQASGQGFIVQSQDGKIYKAGTEPDCQILTEKITADVGAAAMTNFESLNLEDDELGEKLAPFSSAGKLAFISGEVTLDDPDDATLSADPYQFPFARITANTLKLEAAPVDYVVTKFGEQFATGQLSIRSIIKNGETFTNPSTQAQF